MERYAVGFEPLTEGVLEHVHRHLGHAAELARQRPLGACAIAQDAAEHPHVRSRDAGRDCSPPNLVDFGFAIDREEAHAEREAADDVAFLLDRVAERNPIGRRAGRKRKLDLDDRSRVKARAEIGQELEDCRIRVCLHGVEDARVWKSPGEFGVVVAHHVEVDDDARSVLTSVAQEFANTLCHRRSPTKAQWRLSRLRIEVQTFEPAKAQTSGVSGERWHCAIVRWRHEGAMGSSPDDAALVWRGNFPVRTRGNDKQASSVLTFGGPTRPKKPVRRCFKSRPSLRTRYAGFASGCRLGVSRTRTFSGGCPASCPDAHQPARNHGHVRNWAGPEIGAPPPDHKCFLLSGNTFLRIVPRQRPKALHSAFIKRNR